MKKFILIAVPLCCFIISCNKNADDLVRPNLNTQNDNNGAAATTVVLADPLYTWYQLPTDLKNATLVNPSNTNKPPVESFGPYGSTTGNAFTSFPPYGSKVYAMGMNSNSAGLNKLVIWYKGTDGHIYYFATGG